MEHLKLKYYTWKISSINMRIRYYNGTYYLYRIKMKMNSPLQCYQILNFWIECYLFHCDHGDATVCCHGCGLPFTVNTVTSMLRHHLSPVALKDHVQIIKLSVGSWILRTTPWIFQSFTIASQNFKLRCREKIGWSKQNDRNEHEFDDANVIFAINGLRIEEKL